MTKKLLSHSLNTAVLLILFCGMTIFNLNAQDYVDDPNRDNLPQWYLDSLAKPGYGQKTANVVTIDGYDNFHVATDFAEAHISVNPTAPTEFFATWNIDEAHGTADGYNWYNTQASWGTTIRGDVLTAYDSLGNLYYENMYGSSILGCKVVRSSDNGVTWSSAVTAISGVDKNWMAADQTGGPYSNYIYTVMTSNSGGNFSRSTDFGATWSTTFTPGTQGLPGMMVCVGAWENIQGGAVYVVTNGGNSFASNYTFYQSLNGGQTFQYKSSQNFSGYVGVNSNGRHSVENMRTRPYPFIAADNSYGPYRGRLYLIYASNQPAGNGNKPDIWCRYSDNGGSTFSGPILVNDDENPTAHHQFEPAVWCDVKTGRLYVKWMDTRDTPTSDSAMIYATYSETGGESFMPNQKVSNQKMKINCTSCGGGGTPRYQGDYDAIVSNSKTSMSAWTDFRYGTYASFTGYFPDFAMLASPENLEMAGVDTVWAVIPDVKLYSDTAIFSATIEDPPSGTFSLSYPLGDILTSFPDSIPIVITAEGVPLGSYLMTIKGEGPNGTPVHYRDVNVDLLVLDPPVTEFEASETEICVGETVDFTDLSQNFPNQWFWEFTGGTPNLSNDQNPQGILYNAAGSFNVKLIAVNSSGFTELVKENYITVSEAPDAPLAENVYVCGDETVPPLMATGENIRWYDDPDLLNLVFEGSSFETGQTEFGQYMYYVTQTIGCESPAIEVMLSISELPAVSLAEFDGVCKNAEPFELTGGLPENGTYFGDGVEDGMFDPMVPLTDVVTIGYEFTNENLCSDTAYQDIMLYDYPQIDLGSDTSLCAELEIILDATWPDAVSYMWTPGNETTSSITVDSAGIGIGSQIFEVEVIDNNGCMGTSSVVVSFVDCSGVGEIPALQRLQIYPNPSDGHFSVMVLTSEKITADLEIYDGKGKIHYNETGIEMNGSYQTDIQLPKLTAGLYYLIIRNDDGMVMRKIAVR
ncbi:MAG: T9SS type A sorting domain-containing protein [Bacteroidales bacterium]|nr:T9SS type A sorting domain-containing protein [Bacteroidales bacterium]MCF8405087.1 T9SS type A sorting domain-containing protein [Bacteroidales bacterium]